MLSVPKLNKPKYLSTSYRLISLLPVLGKLLKKLLLKIQRSILHDHYLIPNSFGFAIDTQLFISYRLSDKITFNYFLDIAQEFDRVSYGSV